VRAYARTRKQVTSDRYKDIYEVAESEPSRINPMSSPEQTTQHHTVAYRR